MSGCFYCHCPFTFSPYGMGFGPHLTGGAETPLGWLLSSPVMCLKNLWCFLPFHEAILPQSQQFPEALAFPL